MLRGCGGPNLCSNVERPGNEYLFYIILELKQPKLVASPMGRTCPMSTLLLKAKKCPQETRHLKLVLWSHILKTVKCDFSFDQFRKIIFHFSH